MSPMNQALCLCLWLKVTNLTSGRAGSLDLAQGLSDFLTLSTVSRLKKCFLVWVDVLRAKAGIGHSALCNKMPQLEEQQLSAVLCFGSAAELEGTSGWALLYTLKASNTLIWSRWFRIYLLGSDASIQ